jgi:phosphotransferase system HPr (HPr) family protein
MDRIAVQYSFKEGAMKQLHLTVINDVGLHARPAAIFVKKATQFHAEIHVRNATTDSDWVNAKSILSVLTLGVEKDHEIEISLEGPDEEAGATALQELIRSGLTEG